MQAKHNAYTSLFKFIMHNILILNQTKFPHTGTTLSYSYIINKMECFSYKGGCGIIWAYAIDVFKRRAGLGHKIDGFNLKQLYHKGTKE